MMTKYVYITSREHTLGSAFDILQINQLYLSHHCLHKAPPIFTACGSHTRSHLRAKVCLDSRLQKRNNYLIQQKPVQVQKEHLSHGNLDLIYRVMVLVNRWAAKPAEFHSYVGF